MNTLSALFHRADNPQHSAFNDEDTERWGLNPHHHSFIQPATPPTHIHCIGCEESCFMPILYYENQASICCDKQQSYGIIKLQPDDLRHWQLNVESFAQTLAELLALENIRPITLQRLYDLGVWHGHSILLMGGVNWQDAEQIFQKARLYADNPLFITLTPAPHDFAYPHIDVGKILFYKNDSLIIDTARLLLLTTNTQAPQGNLFLQQGDMWRIRFDGQEVFIKHSTGMTYLRHLLLNPHQDIPAVHLQQLVNKAPETLAKKEDPAFLDSNTLGKDAALDKETIQSIKVEIARLEILDEDSPEIQALKDYLLSNTFRGKAKDAITADNERARQAITQAIKVALDSINKHHPALATHIKSSLKQGQQFTYTPATKIIWQ